jgi:uncharacterized protein with FMN-binding domain
MIRKTALLITGTIAGVVGVVSYNPPQLIASIDPAGTTPAPQESTQTSMQSPAQPAPTASTTKKASTKNSSATSQSQNKNSTPQEATTSPAPTASTTKKASTKNSSATSQSQNQNSTTQEATTSPAPVATTKQSSGITGNFKGDTSQTRWGPVQVEIVVTNGKITDVKTLQYPNGDRRSLSISSKIIPWLQEETLQIQSANISGISGATYTSMGFKDSLASALQKAGL